MRRRSSLIDNSERKILSLRFPTFAIPNLHLLEDGLVKQDSESLMRTHDEPSFPLFVVLGNIKLECPFSLFMPTAAVEVVELSS